MGESLRRVCRDLSMPGLATVVRWLDKFESFRVQYARAKELQAEYLVDEIIEISDDGTNDYMAMRDKEGAIIGWRENGEYIQRSRLRVDARKWAASKMAPKKYGDHTQLQLSGKVAVDTTKRLDVTTLEDDQLDALEAALRQTILQLDLDKSSEDVAGDE